MPLLQFPDNFLWGASASAYQIEGAYNEDGKGPSIWDRFVEEPAHVVGGQHGRKAIDHYHRMPEDVALMAELGLPSYSFTVSWTRILPEGRGKVNAKGLDFYSRLVDSLLEAGIQPKATLFHWDLPQALQEQGGWAARKTSDYFADYAREVVAALQDRVKLWATINEPWVAAFLGYATGLHAPGICDYSQAYAAAYHLMLAHGKAVQVFRSEAPDGEIGLVLNLNGLIPASDKDEDVAATRRVFAETHDLFLDPLFKGEFPEDLFEFIGSHRPEIKATDGDITSQPLDFLGLNHYNSDLVSYDVHAGLLKARLRPYSAPGWGQTEMHWGIHPLGLYGELLHLKENYGNPRVIITENGAAFPDNVDAEGQVHDTARINFLRAHLQAAHRAIEEGANVHGYYVWSIFDNFEWERGYGPRFGIVHIDYETLQRIPKQSAHWFREVIRNNAVHA